MAETTAAEPSGAVVIEAASDLETASVVVPVPAEAIAAPSMAEAPAEAIAVPSAAVELEAAEPVMASEAELPAAVSELEPLAALSEAAGMEASADAGTPVAAIEAVEAEPVQAVAREELPAAMFEALPAVTALEPPAVATAPEPLVAAEAEAPAPSEMHAVSPASLEDLAASTPLQTSSESGGQPETIGALAEMVVRLHQRLGERYPEVPDDPPYVSRSMITASMAFVPTMPETNGSAPSMPAEAMTLTFPGTTGLLPTEIFGGDAALIRYTITLPEARTVRVMFNASSANQVWFDDKPVFSTSETRMAPSFHRVAEDQRADLTLEAGKHQLIAAVRKPQSGLYLEWVVGMADADTLQWLTDVTYSAT
jgi:hypothetical protein